nr:integrase, catalytic region, zinc finger, CCHC-type, peptidase aspartic, catalytic [Tanacetum cinerariifolium]
MTGNRSQLMNFVSKFLGTVRFENDNIARIMGYGVSQLGNVTISRVYYVKGLGHNLFFIGQFCDADLEVVFWKNTCFIRNLEGVDQISRSRDINLYIISFDDMLKTSLICLISKASKTKSWLWHHRLSHLNFGTLNKLAKDSLIRGIPRLKFQKDHLCSACTLEKARNPPIKPKLKTLTKRNYFFCIWICMARCVWRVLTGKDNGTEFINQTLSEFYENVGISHQTSVARAPQQNAINRACYTQNCSLIRLRYNKTPYEFMQDKKPDLSFFHIFDSLCYPTNDNDNLGKLDAKADIGIFVGYAPAKKAFRIYNKRNQKIIETIHVTFDELTTMASEQLSSGLGLYSMTLATSSSGLVPYIVSQQPCISPKRDDWDRLFQPIFDEYFNPSSIVVSPVPVAAALKVIVLADSPVSTSIDQDAPSTRSSSNVRQIHTPFEHLGKWTKDHPIANMIDDPSRSVSTRKQLQTDAMWCYLDAFLTSVEPKNFKQAMTKLSWIDAMQEEIH